MEDEREQFMEVTHLARNELGEFHNLAVDALKGLVKDMDRNLKSTVIQLRSYLQRGMLQSSSLCTQLVQPARRDKYLILVDLIFLEFHADYVFA